MLGKAASKATRKAVATTGSVMTSSSSKSSRGAAGKSVPCEVTTSKKDPEKVTVDADPSTPFGISFANGGLVQKVSPGGQANARGVRKGWRLLQITGSLSVKSSTTPKAVLDALAATRRRGKPYALVFAPFAEEAAEEPRAEKDAVAVGDEPKLPCSDPEEPSRSQPKAVEAADYTAKGDDAGQPGHQENDDVEEKNAEGKSEEEECVRPEVTESDTLQVDRTQGEDGEVTLKYEMYDEKFPTKGGRITAGEIDEVYCLSFAMPNCTLHLGPLSPSERYKREETGGGEAMTYLQEDPPGTFHGLENGGTYWVYVSRDDEEERLDREKMKKVVEGMQKDAAMEAGAQGVIRDDGRNGLESCSCIYGNPCVDEYGCKDWDSRYAVAKANGWKGF